ncbi:MAG: hypothetical protein AAF727_00740 [Pseudomonadota bacterium]
MQFATSNFTPRGVRTLALGTTIIVTLMATGAMAQTFRWNAGDDTWEEGGNDLDWLNGAAAANFISGESARFRDAGDTIAVDAAGVTVNDVFFSADAVTIDGPGTLNVTGAVRNLAGETSTVNAQLVGGARTVAVGTLNIAGGVTGELEVDGAGTVNVTSSVTTLNADAGSTVIAAGGDVEGTSDIASGATVTMDGGTVDDVNNSGTFVITDNAAADDFDNLTGGVVDASGAAADVTLTVRSFDSSGEITTNGADTVTIDAQDGGADGEITLNAGTTFDGNAPTLDGSVILDGNVTTNINLDITNDITLLGDLTNNETMNITAEVDADGNAVNNTGTLNINTGGSVVGAGPSQNSAGGQLTINDGTSFAAGGFTNTGTGSSVTVDGTFDVSGTPPNDLLVDDDATVVVNNDGGTNTSGQIIGDTRVFGGSVTVNGTDDMTAEIDGDVQVGSAVVGATGGTFTLTDGNIGAITNNGVTDLGDANDSTEVTITAGTFTSLTNNSGEALLDGGTSSLASTVSGGTVTNAGAALVDTAGATAAVTVSGGTYTQTDGSATGTNAGIANTGGTVNLDGGTANILRNTSTAGTTTVTDGIVTGTTSVEGGTVIVNQTTDDPALELQDDITVAAAGTLTVTDGDVDDIINNGGDVNLTAGSAVTVDNNVTGGNRGDVDIGGDFTIDDGVTNEGDFDVNSGTTTVTNGTFENETGGIVTIADGAELAAPVITNSGTRIDVGAGSTLRGTGSTLNNNSTINVADGGTVTDAGNINNNAGGIINFNGSGTLNAGGAGTGVIDNSTATSEINVTMGGDTVTVGNDNVDSAGTISVAATSVLNGILTLDQTGGTITGGGTVETGGFTQSGGAANTSIAANTTVTASGASTLSGGTIAGTLNGIGSKAVDTDVTVVESGGVIDGGATTVETGGTLQLAGGTVSSDLTLDGGILEATANSLVDGTNVTLTTANGGTIRAEAGDTLTINPTTLSSGPGALTVGDATNTGTVVLNSTNATQVASGTLSVEGGTLRFDSAAAASLYDGSVTGQSVAVSSGAFIDVNGNDSTLADLSGAGTVTSSAIMGTPTVTINALNDTSFGGDINDGNGETALTKTGAATTTVTSALSYTGTTTVEEGELALTGNGALASTDIDIINAGSELSTDGGALDGDAEVDVGAGATFDLTGSETIAALTGAGTTSLTGATTTLDLGGTGVDSTIDGIVNGTGQLEISGAQTTVNGTITDVATTVSGGSLVNSGTVAGLTNSGGTVTLTDTSTTASLTQDTIGVSTTVTGTAQVIGLSDIDAGILNIASGNVLTATGGVDAEGGTTINLDGTIDGNLTTAGALVVSTDNAAVIDGNLTTEPGSTIDLNGSMASLDVTGTSTGDLTVEIDTMLNGATATDAGTITNVTNPDGTLNLSLGVETGAGDFIDALVLTYDGSSQNLSFGTISGFTDQGALDYFLEDDGAGNVFLRATTASAVSGVAATVGLTQTLVNTIVNRPTSPFVADLAAGAEEEPCGVGVWTRITGGTANANGAFTDVTAGGITGNSPVGLNYAGLQFGGDFACFGGAYNGWDLAFGAIGGFNDASSTSSSFGATGALENTLTSDIFQKYAGVYVTAARGRFFADLQFRYEDTEFESQITQAVPGGSGLADFATEYDNSGQTLSGAVGYSWQVADNPNLTFVSSAGFSISKNRTDDVQLSLAGDSLTFQDGFSRVGFLSASLANTRILPDEVSLVSYFGTATIYNDFADDRTATFNLSSGGSRELALENLGAYGEVSLGVNYLTLLSPGQAGNARQLNASVRLDARFSSEVESYGITGQLRLQF